MLFFKQSFRRPFKIQSITNDVSNKPAESVSPGMQENILSYTVKNQHNADTLMIAETEMVMFNDAEKF